LVLLLFEHLAHLLSLPFNLKTRAEKRTGGPVAPRNDE